MQPTADPCHAERGFTGRELFVVVALLCVSASLLVRVDDDRGGEARAMKAWTESRVLADAAKVHYQRRGHRPMLHELVERDATGWRAIDEVPRDPWGHDYVVLPGRASTFVVLSPGPNGAIGDADDITSRTLPR